MEDYKTIIVVNSVHDPNRRKYDEKIMEVSAYVAEEQLSKPESERNVHWRTVRYATDEEVAIFKGENPNVEKKSPGRPKAIKTE